MATNQIDKDTVLVINDTADQLELMSVLLRQAGYHVIAAEDGREGFSMAKRERPRLIISDVLMPHLDGIELCRRIRADDSLHLTPVLLVSAMRKDTESAVEGLSAGADDYLEAPYEPMHLIAKVARLVERARIEEHYREIVEQASDIIYTRDMEGHITSINEAGARFFGQSREELVGRHVGELLGVSDPEEFVRIAVEELRQSVQWRQQVEVHRPSGNIRWLDLSRSLIRDHSNEAVGVRSIARDITEQKQAEEALRESEERFRALIENSSDAVALLDSEGVVRYASPSTVHVLGYTPEEFVGRNAIELIHTEDREYVTELLNGLTQRAGAIIGAQYRCLHRDGSWVWLEGVARNLLEEPNVRAIVSNYRDITESKMAQESLNEANTRAILEYERLLERITQLARTLGTARDLTIVFRALLDFALVSTPCNGLFISLYNPEHERRTAVYAWSDGEEVDVSMLPPMEMNESPHSRAVSTSQVIITDDYQSAIAGLPRIDVGDQERLPRSSLTMPMAVMGRIVGAVELQSTEPAAFREEHATAMSMAANLAANAIENVRLLEREREQADQLRQSQKLESVGQLAGGIAHDFNNLLTVITGYGDLLLRQIEEGDPKRRNLEEIRGAAERATSLTRQLLAFSRKQVMQPKVLDLTTTVTNMDSMLQRLIGEDVRLVTILDKELGKVKADPGQVEQVMMNLVVNARDAMPGGGKITIETKNVYLDESYARRHVSVTPGRYVMLAVSDTGHGMDKETLACIFEPFFTTKETGKGTGLGLAMVYGIVKQSGGNIWVYSEPGHGTTFKVYLPVVEEEAESIEQGAATPEIMRGTETIMLVEDEEVVRELLRDMLEAEGYTVLEASHGGEALQICERHEGQIHLLMTDVVMPGMSGRELTERLTAKCSGVKVLYMSGYTDDAIVHHGVLDPEVAFLQKPFTLDGVARKVREVLDSTEVRV